MQVEKRHITAPTKKAGFRSPQTHLWLQKVCIFE
jgi:hypothetical protein